MQKDTGLAELKSIIIKKSVLEIQPRLVILCYLFAYVEYGISWLFYANIYGINIATRLEKRLKKVIYNMTVL